MTNYNALIDLLCDMLDDYYQSSTETVPCQNLGEAEHVEILEVVGSGAYPVHPGVGDDYLSAVV